MCSAMGAYPLNHFPAREAFFKILTAREQRKQERLAGSSLSPMISSVAAPKTVMSQKFLMTSTVIFWFASYVLSVLIHDLSYVFDILGSTAAVVVIFIVPSQLWKRLAQDGEMSQAPQWILLSFG